MTVLDNAKFDGLEAGPDLDFIAENIVKAKRKLKKPAPAATDLATAIVGLSINDTIHGSSTMNVTILDEDFALLDSGFFDANADGRLDAIDVNYPDGSKLWWRLTQCNPRSSNRVEMVFMERAAAHLMAHHGPLKVSRSKRTRAQFLKMLCGKVKGQPIIFVSHDLNVRQTPGGEVVTGRVMNAGDSLAVGTDAPLSALRPSVVTRATVGFTSSQVLSDLESAGQLPKTLVISAGTNDTNVATFRSNVQAIVALPGVDKVLWLNISRPVLGGVTDTELNDVLREEAAGSSSLRILGWKYQVEQGRVHLGGDSIHPDAAGYKFRAKMIDDALGHATQTKVPAQTTAEQRKATKSPGITPDPSLTIAGGPALDDQLAQVERALDVATKLNAPELAVLAMVCAGIGESNFTTKVNSLGYGGVFQGQVNTGGHYFKKEDTEGEATSFLEGTKGFGGGGAIALANAHPTMDPGDIATKVEVSGQPGHFYGKWIDEAKALIAAYGGGSFGTTSYRKQYNFEVGTTDKPHENFWDACNRLAAEVKWPFFLDGQYAYFDPETTLIKQKPSLVLERDDVSVLSWQCDWDARHIATELRVDLICDAFEFRAGEVWKMIGFGPASTGSTAKLPGRWLISEIDRDRSNIYSSFTLKQPEAPDPEPVSELGTRAGDPAAAGGDITGTPKDIIDNVVLPIARECGIAITPNQVEAANARHGPTVDGNRSDHQGPPETAWAADMGNGVSTPEEAKLAQALADKFDIPWTGAGLVTVTHGSYRYQLIHNTDEGGDHFNHVHFGVRVT